MAPTASCQGRARFPNPAAAGPGSGALLLAPALAFQAQQGLLESRESRAASDNAAGCGGASPPPFFGRWRRPPGKRHRALPCTSCSPHSTRPYLHESLRLCLLLQFLPSCSPSLPPRSPALAPAQKCLSAAHGLRGQAQPWPPLGPHSPGRRKAAQRFALKWVQEPWPQPCHSGPRFPSVILPSSPSAAGIPCTALPCMEPPRGGHGAGICPCSTATVRGPPKIARVLCQHCPFGDMCAAGRAHPAHVLNIPVAGAQRDIVGHTWG